MKIEIEPNSQIEEEDCSGSEKMIKELFKKNVKFKQKLKAERKLKKMNVFLLLYFRYLQLYFVSYFSKEKL